MRWVRRRQLKDALLLRGYVLDINLTQTVELNEPDLEFAHLKQITHAAHGQIFEVLICYIVLTQQYRSYVFCNGEFVSWVLDPGIDHSVAPETQNGIYIIEQLIDDAVAEIEANHHEIYCRKMAT